MNNESTPKISGSPRPTYAGPTAIPYQNVTKFLWGDEESGHVADWIYASTDLIHMLVYAIPPAGQCLHSNEHRTIFGADVVYFVLDGCLLLANPEKGEIQIENSGEAILFRKDTWHHIFSHSTKQLRVLEFFAPPPSTGASRAYAKTRPYLDQIRYTDDSQLGIWPEQEKEKEKTLHLRTERDYLWRREGDALIGIVVSTEHLTVATLSILPGGKSTKEIRGGDETLYVLEGVLHVLSESDNGVIWVELNPGDGYYCPRGTLHQYYNYGSDAAKAVVGVAPNWSAE